MHQRLVGRVVSELFDGKATGVSAWRNSHLKAIAAEEQGLRALTRWSQAWVDGLVPEVMAR